MSLNNKSSIVNKNIIKIIKIKPITYSSEQLFKEFKVLNDKHLYFIIIYL